MTQWILIAGKNEQVFVNGKKILSGVRVISDKDEIRVSEGRRFHFSGETLPVKEQFPGMDRNCICPRCRKPIEKGQMAVRCTNPRCLLWHHETEESPCWTFDEACGSCTELTDLDREYSWYPQEA